MHASFELALPSRDGALALEGIKRKISSSRGRLPHGWISRLLLWLVSVVVLTEACGLGKVVAAEVIPPKPARYFNDYAGVVSPAVADRLNRTLEEFERSASSQVVVVIYPKMQSDSSVQDYTVRIAQGWGVGQKSRNNGAVLFVFMQEHQVYLQVGYGLEGAIPDATAKRIIEEQITPRFRAGDIDGGMTAGVNAILQAARGEYRGTGRTVAEGGRRRPGQGWPLVLIVLILLALMAAARRAQGTVYRGTGRSPWTGWPGGWGGGGWPGGWRGGSRGGGWSSGGGFSSGGGSFGGGGAGGRW